MKNKSKHFFALIALLCLALYLIPVPHRISIVYPAVLFTDNIPDTTSISELSINAWEYNYLFRNNIIKGKISLQTQGTMLFENFEFSTRIHNSYSFGSLANNVSFYFELYVEDINGFAEVGVHMLNNREYIVIRGSIYPHRFSYIASTDIEEKASEIYCYITDYIVFK